MPGLLGDPDIETWSAEGSASEFAVRDGVIDYLTVDSESGALFYRKFLPAPLHRRTKLDLQGWKRPSGPDLLVFEGDAMVRFHWGQAFWSRARRLGCLHR